MHASDLVLGAGGTMTREGALLGVPTLSLFAGRTPAVDRWLEERGALRRVSAAGELPADPAPGGRAPRSRLSSGPEATGWWGSS